jgi:hypothetical protein
MKLELKFIKDISYGEARLKSSPIDQASIVKIIAGGKHVY